MTKKFLDKVKDRQCDIAVIGLGYVGVPLLKAFCNAGFNVLGVDIDQPKVEELMLGKCRIAHIDDAEIAGMVESGRFEATTDFSKLGSVDAILLCIPTPLNQHREPDLSFVENTARAIASHLRKGQIVILESTTYPGTSREILAPLLEQGSNLTSDRDFFVAYSPEREDPANSTFDIRAIPKVVGAGTQTGLEMAVELYGAIVDTVVPVSNSDTAEAVKLTENIFRAVNIALVNELKLIYGDMGIDIWEVIEAAKTKPFGFMPFYPGPGLGGHCIPIDPFYLTWRARAFGRHTRFIELAGEINHFMPQHIISVLATALNLRQKKSLNGAHILLIGVAYKKNVDDMRESPSLVLMELLKEQMADFDYFDPFIPIIPETREHMDFAGMKSVDWSPENLQTYDAVVIATDHDNINWEEMVCNSRLVIDTRNATSEIPNDLMEKVVKA